MIIGARDFVTEMERLWTGKLGNQSNEGFQTVWGLMAETYIEAIAENMKWHPSKITLSPPRWRIIAPEMGSGKTYGACLYLGMMARTARRTSFPLALGGLLVCRTINQCEEAVKQINEHAGYVAAVTRHSQNSITLDDTKGYPALVITHAALVNPDDCARNALITSYYEWKGGRRCLAIIDEALANAVEFHSVTEQSLNKLLGLIPPTLREKHPLAWDIVDSLLKRIQYISQGKKETYGMWDKVEPGNEAFGVKLPKLFDSLVRDLRIYMQTQRRSRWNDKNARDADVDEAAATLNAIIVVFRHWTLFVKKGAEAGMMSARLLLPDLWCPVMLNATANQDVLLDHMAATIVPMPKVRSYKNLTLRILRTKGIGKEAMMTKAQERLQQLGEFIRNDAEVGDQWLVVTHKGTEDIARLHLPEHLGTTAHWGALDGLNTFKECNKAVLFGLSYRDPTWSPALYFALRGKQPDDWFKSDAAREIKQNLEAKSMAAQVLQALGRPRSRRVSDEDGNCLPTTVYLTLPDNNLGRAIEEHIRNELPGVAIGPWTYQLDGPKPENHTAPINLAAAVVTHMQNRQPGRYTVSEIADSLDLDNRQKNALKDGLKKMRKVYDDLAAIGVTYEVTGERRGAKSYLVKNG